MTQPARPSRIRAAATAVRSHPAVTAVLVVAVALWIVLGALVGMPVPVVVVLPVIVAVLAVVGARLGARRAVRRGTTPARAGGVGTLGWVVAATLVTFAAIQAVPYGRAHSNPPVTGEPQWATPETRELMVRACYGCHSNEVDYPAYASVAPISWAIQAHVDEGREAVNYSEFATDPGEADESIEVIREGEMPPGYYTRFGLHSEAKLTDAEIATLIAGLEATPGLSERGEGRGYGGYDDED
jgi:hypothetical protein